MKTVNVLRCLSEETRLHAMLLVNRHGELCVCELVEALGDSQPKVSRHLGLLRDCGLLVGRRRGQWVFYALPVDLPGWICGILAEATTAEIATLVPMQQRLEAMSDRPERCAMQATVV